MADLYFQVEPLLFCLQSQLKNRLTELYALTEKANLLLDQVRVQQKHANVRNSFLKFALLKITAWFWLGTSNQFSAGSLHWVEERIDKAEAVFSYLL